MEYVAEWKEIKKASGRTGLRDHVRHGALSLLSLFTKPQPGPSLRLVYLHSVFNDQIAAFEKQIAYLSRIGSFLTGDEVLEIVNGTRPLEKRYFHLSFDDGFRNVIANALPVLRAHGVPATFFVPTERISANYKSASQFGRGAAYYPRAIEMSTWSDLGRAQENGLEIASHTRSHARLSEISNSAQQLEDEIFGSKADIERELGRPCSYISWPFGRRQDVNSTALDCVRRASYTACFGAFRGRVIPGQTDPFSIPRHHFEAHWPFAHFKYFVHGAHEGKEE